MMTSARSLRLAYKIMLLLPFLFGFQVLSCSAKENDIFIPSPKVKSLEPEPTTSTPIPVTERDLWGLRMWQVVGLALVATILLVVFCCCLCDCRVPKTGYDKGDAENPDDDGSDTEPSVFHSKPPQAGKLVNGSSQQIGDKKKRPDSENEDGKVNEAFVGERETPAQGKGWKTVQKTMLSRQP